MLFCLCANTSYPISGGYCGEVPPLPIPNREVKPTCADGTAMQCGRVGSRLLLSGSLDYESSRGFFFVTQISQMTQIFSLLLFFAAFPIFPQISQMCTDFRPVRSWMTQILTCSVWMTQIYKKTGLPSWGQPSLILFVFTVITCLLLRLLRFAGRSIGCRLFLAYRSRIAG